jgi:LacI family transcriptional regulator
MPRLGEKTSRRKGSAVTIHEVARHASVSPMTVSRVINGESNVRDSTRATVMEAVRVLNYRPNPAARVLAGARDTRIAIIYSNPSASYLSEMLVGALDGSHRTASQLVLDRWDNLKPGAEKAAAQRLSEGIAGVILPPPLCESQAIAAAFAAEGVPVVALATGRARDDVACVRIDDFHAAREMTLHLIAQGHSRIAFIKGQPTQTASAQRLAGFEAAMEGKQPRGRSVAGRAGILLLQVRARSRRETAGPQAHSDRDLRQQRRHGRGGNFGSAPARARCAE